MQAKDTHIDNIIPDDFKGKKLYHYTSGDGLMGMILEGKIWCTQIFYLNDREEIINGWRMFFELLNDYDDTFKKSLLQNPNINAWNKLLFIQSNNDFIDFSEFPIHDYPYFVFCLSSKGDDLSQWRGYSPDNSGFAIEFDFNENFFKKSEFITTKEQDSNKKGVILLKRCIYKNKDKKELLKKILDHYKQNNNKTWDVFFEIVSLFFFFKAEAFHHEKEYRLLIGLNKKNLDKIKFRKGKSTLIPYLEINVEYSIFTGIRLGPTTSRQHSKSSIKMLIKRTINEGKNLQLFEPKYSKIPYRTW